MRMAILRARIEAIRVRGGAAILASTHWISDCGCSQWPARRSTSSWGSEFYQYGVSLNVPLTAADTIRVWDVSKTSRWNSLLGSRIQETRVFWSWVEGRDIGRVHYPQDVRLTFDGGREVYISALEIRPDGSFMGMMEHITVFFEDSVARQFSVGVETPE
jgi:hypothetical protein